MKALIDSMNVLTVALASIICAGGITADHAQGIGHERLLAALQDQTKSATSSRADEHDTFKDVQPLLIQKTRVPLRLPTLIPDSGDKESPVYAIIESAEPASYEIQLAWTKDCNGGNSCHYGTVRGSIKPLVEEDRVRVPVLLGNGIKGYFIDSKCGAHCDDASVGWTEGEYHYAISLKAEKKQTLLKVANSAIAAVHRQNR